MDRNGRRVTISAANGEETWTNFWGGAVTEEEWAELAQYSQR